MVTAGIAVLVATSTPARAEVITGPLMRPGEHIASSRAPGFTTLWSVSDLPSGQALTAYRPAEGSTLYEPPSAVRHVNDIEMTAHNDGWLVGYYYRYYPVPFVARFDGRRWWHVAAGFFDVWQQTYPTQVTATAPDDVWISGQQQDVGFGVIWHFDGRQWRDVLSPPDTEHGGISRVMPLGPDDAWVAAGGIDQSALTEILHWNGSGWQDHSPPAGPGSTFDLIGATSPTSVWAIVHDDPETYVVQWDGHEWRPQPGPTSVIASDAVPGGNLWVLTSPTTVMRSTWHGWTSVAVPNACTGRHSEWRDVEVGRSDVYLTGACVSGKESYLLTLRYDGTRWTRV